MSSKVNGFVELPAEPLVELLAGIKRDLKNKARMAQITVAKNEADRINEHWFNRLLRIETTTEKELEILDKTDKSSFREYRKWLYYLANIILKENLEKVDAVIRACNLNYTGTVLVSVDFLQEFEIGDVQ